jgi:hypothetical protein
VQTLPSSQDTGFFTHWFAWQKAFTQTLPSQQSLSARQHPEILVNVHPLTGLQESAVHALPSVHETGSCWHFPAGHQSSVQESPSSQSDTSTQQPWTGTNWQPLAASQVSAVHGSSSAHVTSLCWHLFAVHQSSVQELKSLQSAAARQHPATTA